MKNLLTSGVVLTTLTLFFACGGERQAETKTEQKQTMESHEGHTMEAEMATDMVVDPVCGMKVKKEDAVATVEHEGETYYFCMEADKTAFVKNPEKYVADE